jgi:hypothetical protein
MVMIAKLGTGLLENFDLILKTNMPTDKPKSIFN